MDTYEQTDGLFFAKIQSGLTDWAKLVLATGSSLKGAKCHASVASVHFVNGQCRMKRKQMRPKLTFKVPQKEGPQLHIHLLVLVQWDWT